MPGGIVTGCFETFVPVRVEPDDCVMSCRRLLMLAVLSAVLAGSPVYAAAQPVVAQSDFEDRLRRLVTFQDYNTWVPLLATAILGLTAGVIGVFMVLRRRALVGDVIGHAALPGILIAFLVMESIQPGTGRQVPLLLLGAFLSGLAGAGCVLLIDRYSRIKSDAALAIVLGMFYGLGTVLLSAAQRLPTGSQAGLKDYLSGKTASLLAEDVWLMLGVAIVLLSLTMLLFKEWTLICFDDSFARAIGRPVAALDLLLMALVAVVAIIGMKSVGLILVVALLLIPAAAARFWTDDIRTLAVVSGAIGAFSGVAGVAASSLAPRVAAGPTIVLCGGVMFGVSLLVGTRRGVLWRWRSHRRLQRRVARQDLLRAWFEIVELQLGRAPTIDDLMAVPLGRGDLLRRHPGALSRLPQQIRRGLREGLLRPEGDGRWCLTRNGAESAIRTTRNHRLWEMYLIQYADVAPGQVHRDADVIEHVLDGPLIAELERLVDEQRQPSSAPVSPHPAT